VARYLAFPRPVSRGRLQAERDLPRLIAETGDRSLARRFIVKKEMRSRSQP